jgi:hypothetical protein
MYGPAVDIGIQYGAFSMTSTYRQWQGRFSVCSRWQRVELPCPPDELFVMTLASQE